MTKLGALGFSDGVPRVHAAVKTEQVMLLQPLQRVLAFTGRSIDQVVNDPIAKREVLGYYKLHRWVERGIALSELERQWGA